MSRKVTCKALPEQTKELARWYQSSLGQELQAQEKEALEVLLPGLFGYYLLYVGGTGCPADPLGCSSIRTVINCMPDPSGEGVGLNVEGDGTSLPFASDSIDAVIISHTLDFTNDPHRVLREVERVLIPEGKVIILGFNAMSLWGAWRLLCLRSRAIPWCGRFLSLSRLDDWLSLLGFEVQQVKRMMFIPPIPHSGLIRRISFFERMGRRYWSMFPGAYAVQAVKRVSTLTPIEPAWKLRSRVLGNKVVEPTARNSSREMSGE